MKIKNILFVLLTVFSCYNAYVCAGDEATGEYIVKINGIKMERSSAENLFRYIAETNNGAVEAHDIKNSSVLIKEVFKGMDVVIENDFLETVLAAYTNCLRGSGEKLKILLDNEDTKCVISRLGCKINMCVDKKSSVINKLLILD